ncbi:uncharacterized protein LOC115043728 isoform X3 [Echeneis naucrates]|uniref:uncharacterized protein LOC115043728 isoform X3 n=1 Tax=Echeneis naucrates TaxID=173247 RepID=UPI0011146B16|nr:uncharacterized protein LOC115043728 isoform X3 [Echeneis naucrates]
MHADNLCNMEIIFLCLIFLEAGSWETEAVSLTGNLHSDITIKCSHANAYSNMKYFCKGACNYEDVLITSKEKILGRYSIKDEGNTFFVTIQRLTQEDAGTYWCGIDRVGADTFIQVVLSVVKGKAQDADLLNSIAEKLVYIGAGLGVAVLVMVLVIVFRCRKRDSASSGGSMGGRITGHSNKLVVCILPSILSQKKHPGDSSNFHAQEDEVSNGRTDRTENLHSDVVLSEAGKPPGGLCYSTVSFIKSRDESMAAPLPATVTYSTIADMSTDEIAVCVFS